MSLVMTPSSSSAASSRQTIAISELLPVPTGPATPRRNERWFWSGMEQPHSLDGVSLCEHVDQRSAVRRYVGRRRRPADGGDEFLDVRMESQQPTRRFGRIDREQLERGGYHGLRVVVPDQPGGLFG